MKLIANSVGALVALTLRDPASAARQVIGFGYPRDALWTFLTLVSIANAVLVWLSNALTGPTAEELAQLPIQIPQMVFSPLFLFIFLAGALVISVHVLQWIGAAIGGEGTLDDMLSALVWLQSMRVFAQAILLVLLVAVPPLAGLFGFAVVFISFWILVHFVNEAAKLQSVFKTIGVLLSAAVGIIIGLTFIMTITGLTSMGISPNV